MFASNLFRDEVELRQFLTDVELDLREGRSLDAIERVDFALGVLEEFDHPIAAMCRACPPSAIRIRGWDKLAKRLSGLDQPDRLITAIGIDLSSHGDFHANVDEEVAPYLETNFYSDNAFAFSNADRATICAGYGTLSSDWAGSAEHIDETIEISGIGRLNFAIDALESEHRLERSDDPLVSDAMVFAVAYRAVAVHHAVRTMVEAHGLPRPLTILVGSHDSYPFFDAPVITAGEYSERTAVHETCPVEETVVEDLPVDEDLVDEPIAEPETEEVPFLAKSFDENLREPIEPNEDDISEVQQNVAPAEALAAMTSAEQHRNPNRQLSGSEIRRRFSEPSVTIQPQPKPGLLNRLFSRS